MKTINIILGTDKYYCIWRECEDIAINMMSLAATTARLADIAAARAAGLAFKRKINRLFEPLCV